MKTHSARVDRNAAFRIAAISLSAVCISAGAFGAPVITINPSDTGRVYQGVGGLSAGASSRLLIDYPKKQRDEILDYLFKPNYGAALQINKVEVGSDTNSTDGSEPSHERTPGDRNFHRGYEWWLMQQSKLRNPNIKFYILEWGAPNWINPSGDNVWTPENYKFLIDFIDHAKSDYGLNIDYVGGWNESNYDKNWNVGFRNTLNSSGHKGVKIVTDDNLYWAANDFSDVGVDAAKDPVFASSVDIIGQHYPDYSPAMKLKPGYKAALGTGKPIWATETGSGDYNGAAGNLAKAFNQGYINNRVTANINWSTIWSAYNNLPFYGCGLMLANEPWSGHYEVGKSIWACAQTTQFVQLGWRYLDHACCYLSDVPADGSCVALKAPNNVDYSVIIETSDAHSVQTQKFRVSGTLANVPLHVWATSLHSSHSSDWFVRQPDIASVHGQYTIVLQPGHIYSLTTTTGQKKGATSPPPSVSLPLPYRDNLSSYALGTTPRYFSDQEGTFEIGAAQGGRKGKCLRQVITARPVLWHGNDGPPSTVVGDARWTNYAVSCDAYLEQPGYVDLIGHIDNSGHADSNHINGCHLRASDNGQWSIISADSGVEDVLAHGVVRFPIHRWHTMKLVLSGFVVSAYIDGAKVVDGIMYAGSDNGMAGLQVSPWIHADFQNFIVTPVPGDAVRVKIIHPIRATATSENKGFEASKAVDNDPTTFWHTRYQPASDTLPQSITLDLGSATEFNTLLYYPRHDYQSHGNITQYVIEGSVDGVQFTQIAAGIWPDSPSRKLAHFATIRERYLRLKVLAGDGNYASASEINVAKSADAASR